MKIEWIGRSACLISKRESTAHDMASQTERVLVHNDGLVILSELKIQSKPDIEILSPDGNPDTAFYAACCLKCQEQNSRMLVSRSKERRDIQ